LICGGESLQHFLDANILKTHGDSDHGPKQQCGPIQRLLKLQTQVLEIKKVSSSLTLGHSTLPQASKGTCNAETDIEITMQPQKVPLREKHQTPWGIAFVI